MATFLLTFGGKNILCVQLQVLPFNGFYCLVMHFLAFHCVLDLHQKEPMSLETLYPSGPPKALRLLKKMICWNPSERISVGDALRDLFVNCVRTPHNEPICDTPLAFDIDIETVVF